MLSVARYCLASAARVVTKNSRNFSSQLTPRGKACFMTGLGLRNVQTIKVLGVNPYTSSSLSPRLAHTSGDKDLVEFLKDEIKMEKEGSTTQGKLPKLKGFEITSTDGPNVVLTKKMDNETVVIKLNVNNAVDESLGALEAEQDSEKDAKMVCRPSFVVEIGKGGDRTLAIQCSFPPEDDMPPQEQAEQYDDLIEIQEIALLEKNQEWTDDVYSLSGSIMDGNLYDMLLKLLEERGVDGDFVGQLVEFCTAYEHDKYVSLLEQLQKFAGSK